MVQPGFLGFLYSQLFITPPVPKSDLTGEVHIITGSNTGLGYAAAVHIARLQPAKLILAVRTPAKGEAARQSIVTTTGIDKDVIEVWKLDMSSFGSVLAFSDRCESSLDRLDGVSLNAGIETAKFTLVEGYESTIFVNVIATFLLAVGLLPVLRRSAGKHNITPRLSFVASEVHAWAAWPERHTPADEKIFEVMSDPARNQKMTQMRYMESKLMEVLVFRQFATLVSAKDDSVTTNCLNPGLCYSELGRDEVMGFTKVLRWLLARTQDVGGRTVAMGLVAGNESAGKYMHDAVVDEQALSSYAKSPEGEAMGKRLWAELREVFEKVRPGITDDLNQ